MNNTSNVTNTHNGHKFVDLGLPSGLLWATCNVGATSPEQTGLYFAFGKTIGFTAEQIEKGEHLFDFGSNNASTISGNLTLEQDAAHTYMGGKWRMPTCDEFQELIDNCRWGWMDDYNGTGVAGYIFASKTNSNNIFLPAAGYANCGEVCNFGVTGNYRSATAVNFFISFILSFLDGYLYNCCGDRSYGQPVRGVWEKESSKDKIDQVVDMTRVIDVLTDVAKEYSGKTIENIIVQMKSRVVELRKQWIKTVSGNLKSQQIWKE